MSIGDNIRKARKEAGFTQKELAKRLNVTPSTISQFEHSDNVSHKTIERIARALDYPIGFFFQFADDGLADNYVGIYPVNEELAKKLNNLSAEGKSKVLSYAEDLVASGKYKPVALSEKPSTRETVYTVNTGKASLNVAETVSPYMSESKHEYEPNAAHARTQIHVDEDVDTSEDDIMDDDNF